MHTEKIIELSRELEKYRNKVEELEQKIESQSNEK